MPGRRPARFALRGACHAPRHRRRMPRSVLVYHLRGWDQRGVVRRTAQENDEIPQEACPLVLDSLPAHKTALPKQYVTPTEGRSTLHFLPGYAPGLSPDELVWRHVKRTGTARRPLKKGERLRDKSEEQLAALQKLPLLVHSFFNAPSVAYIGDCRVTRGKR